MFNLLVKFAPWGDGRDSMPLGRTFEYTDQILVDRYNTAGNLNFAELMTLPALFVQETAGRDDQIARVGTITRARINGNSITLDYAYDAAVPPIPNRVLQGLRAELDMEDFEFARTHWAVKDVDLFRLLHRNVQARRGALEVFRLAEFENIELDLISVMMPFDAAFNPVFALLQRTTQEVGLRCLRADNIWENPAVIQDVVSLIDRSNVVICDCTERNPNVFYEMGIAHSIGRQVILITQAAADIPFDVRHLRYVQYLNNRQGLRELGATLQPRLVELAR